MKTQQDVIAAIDAALKAGNKIQAIKLLRNASGMGLKEAKDMIDERGSNIELSLIRNLDDMPGEAAGCTSTMIVLLVGCWLLARVLA